MVDRVHRRHHGQQDLRRADVRRGLLAADVLFARLQRQPIGLVALRVDRHTDQTARHRALEFIFHGHVARVRATEAERHAKALRVAHGHVGAPFARRGDQRQRQQIGSGHDATTGGVHGFGNCAVVGHIAIHARVLQEHAKGMGLRGVSGGADLDLDAERQGARANHFQRLRQDVFSHVERVRGVLVHALQQRHRLGGSGAFVEHRRVGDIQAGQIGDHLLEVQHRFQTALRDFGLVRRVRGVPRRVLEDVAQDDARRERVVVALANEALEHAVLARQRAQAAERGLLGQRCGEFAQRHAVTAADRGGHHGVDQRGAALETEHLEHVLLFGGIGADMTGGEGVARLQFGQRGPGTLGGSVHGERGVHGKESRGGAAAGGQPGRRVCGIESVRVSGLRRRRWPCRRRHSSGRSRRRCWPASA